MQTYQTSVAELFDTLELEHHPTIKADRFGSKSPDKIRPIRIIMESHEGRYEFMSMLYRLKHGSDKFRKINTTEDFTHGERKVS